MARTLFGTDGIRGVAGEYPLDPRTVTAVGSALGAWIVRSGHEQQVVIGMDTRESGPELASLIAGGLALHGVGVDFAGVTTTPGVAYLAKNGPFAAGVMISASHNPYQDNGIKVLGHNGYKLADELEEALEQEILASVRDGIAPRPVELNVDKTLDRTYIDHLASTLSRSLEGLNIVIDCANGSACELAPKLLGRLGATVHTIAAAPDGRNINLNCGSLHVETLREAVLQKGAQVGVAFDGDADRALFISASGRLIDGDAVLLIASRFLKDQGRLPGNGDGPIVVATVMSNLGLELALASHGIKLVRTPVGDKYVLEEMLRMGAALGGEQSGHVIFREFATTGDGMLTALRIFDVMTARAASLDDLVAEMKTFPQVLVNVRVKEKKPLDQLPEVQREIRQAEAAFGNSGRVLVRFSGTEPLVRVMVEGSDAAMVDEYVQRIADRIRSDMV
ncbi:MAG TPA: phosphoglucosamine mutase [Bryobacteraceae bacterium]|nr:phosphoglucosamine mutase [Bryobacteraceae bacterium]